MMNERLALGWQERVVPVRQERPQVSDLPHNLTIVARDDLYSFQTKSSNEGVR